MQAAKVNQNQNEKMTQLNEALKVGDVINESSINTKIKVSFLMQLNSVKFYDHFMHIQMYYKQQHFDVMTVNKKSHF